MRAPAHLLLVALAVSPLPLAAADVDVCLAPADPLGVTTLVPEFPSPALRSSFDGHLCVGNSAIGSLPPRAGTLPYAKFGLTCGQVVAAGATVHGTRAHAVDSTTAGLMGFAANGDGLLLPGTGPPPATKVRPGRAPP